MIAEDQLDTTEKNKPDLIAVQPACGSFDAPTSSRRATICRITPAPEILQEQPQAEAIFIK